MKQLKYLFLVVAIVTCCASCDKDDDDPNLKVVYTTRMDSSVWVSIYSLLDVDNPIMSAESDYTPKTFTFHLNAGDYRFRGADFVPVNFQIRPGKETTIICGAPPANTPQVVYE